MEANILCKHKMDGSAPGCR